MYTVTKYVQPLVTYRVHIASGNLLLVGHIHSVLRNKYTQGQYINLWHTLYTFSNSRRVMAQVWHTFVP